MRMDLVKKKKRKGFTLIELIIVIAIIGILAAIAIPKYSSLQEGARLSADVATGKNIANAAAIEAAREADKSTITVVSLGTQMQGGEPIPKSTAAKTKKFFVVFNGEDVHVYVSDTAKSFSTIENEVFPTHGGIYLNVK